MTLSKLALLGVLLGAWLGCNAIIGLELGEPEEVGSEPTSSATSSTSEGGATATSTSSSSSSFSAGGAAGGAGGTIGQCECGDACAATSTPECPFDVNDPFEVCVADVCEAEEMACCAIDWCPEFVDCVRTTGCESFGCYDAATCKTEIDYLGGPLSSGVDTAKALGDCAVPKCSGCR